MMIRRLGALFVVVALLSSTLVGVLAKALDNESAKHEFEIQTLNENLYLIAEAFLSPFLSAFFHANEDLTQMIYALVGNFFLLLFKCGSTAKRSAMAIC